MAELDPRTISPPLPRPFGVGTPGVPVIDAKKFPPGDDYIWLDGTKKPADISIYWPKPSVDANGWGDGKAQVRRIQFATGSFACARELCSFPDYEKCGPAPWHLHWALIEAGFVVNVERSSIVSADGTTRPQPRFCQYCGAVLGLPHNPDCPTCATPGEAVEGP